MKFRNIVVIAILAVIGAAGGYASAANKAAGMKHEQAAGSVSAEDRSFMKKAAGGGIAEVELAKLALQKASSAEVKHHAQHMLDDHTKANEELEGIASAKGVTLPSEPDPKHKQLLHKLGGMSGAQFDKTYIREAGVNAHKEMETLFKTESSSGQDAEVKAFAAKTLPVVEEHLKDSEKIAAAEGRSVKVNHKGKASTSANPHNGKTGASSSASHLPKLRA